MIPEPFTDHEFTVARFQYELDPIQVHDRDASKPERFLAWERLDFTVRECRCRSARGFLRRDPLRLKLGAAASEAIMGGRACVVPYPCETLAK